MSNSLKSAFEKAAGENYWSNDESLSGPGSNLEQTRIIRKKIPELLKKYSIKKMLDAPCGDLFWMKEILPEIIENGTQYHGADIVTALVEKHKALFSNDNIHFHSIDLTREAVPQVDLVFTRDCFIHLSYTNILSILKNYKRSGCTYLLVNTYTSASRKNFDVDDFYLWGRWLNLQKFPFYFPIPKELIVEGCTENDGAASDKCLGLWKISDINLSRIQFYLSVSRIFNLSKIIFRKIQRRVLK